MEAAAFPEANGALNPPHGVSPDDVYPLVVFRDGREVVSCWKVTAEELAEIQRTSRVWLRVLGQTMPPVAVQGVSPFGKET